MADTECPSCKSKAFKRNGFTRHGKQNLRCLECGRQFSVEPFGSQKTEILLHEENVVSERETEKELALKE